MQDVTDRYQRPSGPSLADFGDALAVASTATENGTPAPPPAAPGAGGPPAGFVVKGGPWEQRAPDTASTHEFPTMGGPRAAPAPAPTASVASAAWGPRR